MVRCAVKLYLLPSVIWSLLLISGCSAISEGQALPVDIGSSFHASSQNSTNWTYRTTSSPLNNGTWDGHNNGTESTSTVEPDDNTPEETHWLVSNTSYYVTISASIIVSMVVIVLNILSLLSITRKEAWWNRFSDVLIIQIYICDIGICMFSVVSSLIFFDKVAGSYARLVLMTLCAIFPMVTIFTTTLIAGCRCRVICRPTARSLRGCKLYSWTISCWLLAATISSTVAGATYYVKHNPTASEEAYEISLIVLNLIIYAVPALANVILYTVSWFALREATRNICSETMRDRHMQNRLAARRLFFSGMLNFVFGLPSLLMVIMFNVQEPSESMSAFWMQATYSEIFNYLIVALINPFIFTGWQVIASSIVLVQRRRRSTKDESTSPLTATASERV